MKKIISMAIAAVMSISMAAAVSAENNPKVYVDDVQISFADQQPVILGKGTTLVPARGVFEAMDAKVVWNGETRTVRIDSSDNVKRIFLDIDNPVMRVYTFTSIMTSDEEKVELDVAPQIIGNRTMIPLRAISEAIDADVKWDGDAYSVLITTKDYKPYTPPENPDTPADENVKTGMSITSSADSVSEGDTVDIYVNLSNLPADTYFSGLTALVSYSKEDFEYQGCSLLSGQDAEENDDDSAPKGMNMENPNHHLGNTVKVTMVTLDDSTAASGAVAKLTFKALTSKGGEFALVNSYDAVRGYDNTFAFTKSGKGGVYTVKGENLFVDTTPVVISGK